MDEKSAKGTSVLQHTRIGIATGVAIQSRTQSNSASASRPKSVVYERPLRLFSWYVRATPDRRHIVVAHDPNGFCNRPENT